MSDQKKLESAAALLGLPGRTPQALVHQAASSLRHRLDAGTPEEDPFCQALVQLANSARLLLLPTSNDAAAAASDITSRAVHIDVSTATLAAAMGLHHAADLTGTAVEIAAAAPPRPPPSSKSLRLRLLPRLSHTAVKSIINLVRGDDSLGIRSRREVAERTSALPSRIQKARLGNRHMIARRRRSQPDPIVDPSPTTAFDMSAMPKVQGGAGRRHSVSFGDDLAAASASDALLASHMPALQQQQQERSSLPASVEMVPRATVQTPRFRARTMQMEKRQKGARGAVSQEKGVMNDAIGTPDDVMEAFMHASHKPAHPVADAKDAQFCIQTVLSERERFVYRLIRQRRAELAAMPLGVTEETRRKAIIEAKQLSLLDLQRVVRYRVCAEMKKGISPSILENGHVPPDNLSRLFRRRDPPVYSYMDGYPRITPFDGIPEMPPRHPETIAQDSIRMAEFDLSRMAVHKERRKKDYVAKLQTHIEKFNRAVTETHNARARVLKGLERYFIEKKRIEERKRKLERIERLKLLRSNDEQAYLNLLKNTKNERLLQLVRQTDNYLMQIGAQVEQQRDAADRILEPEAHDAFAEELGETGDVPLEAMRRRRDLYYTVTHAVQEEVEQPSIMVHGKLKAYQVEGLKWMVSLYNNNLNGILADEMGLGKTIQTIALITYLVEMKKNAGPFMIIVPLSTMGNWIRELDLWAPSLEKIEYRGDRNTRRQIHRTQLVARNFNVLLTTYEFTVKDQSVLSQIGWQYIIIDEGHRMKNADCKLAMTLGIKYKSRNRLLLTGTPLQNNLTELWALLNFLLPSIFSSSDTFETWFKQPFESKTLGDTAELEEEERLLVINRLHQVLRPFLLRRLKTDVESQLPEKVEHVIRCDMSSWQRVLYRQITNRVGLATGAQNGNVRAYNNLLMQCKKVCNHPYLFYDAESVAHLPPDFLIRTSGKFFLLQHMLPKLRLHGHRTLIFSQMTAALDHLELFLSAIGIGYLRLDGNTRADERQELLNLYNQPESPYFCFLLSTRAGGLGLNLQTADTVIIFDSDWNPMMDLQAQDRAHRIGQTRVVRVYRLICSGTVEVKILEQANRKLHVDAQVIQAGQFNNKSTESDRHQMLKDLLRQQNDEEDGVGDVPAMEELNQMIARTEGEAEAYAKYDRESAVDGGTKPLLATEEELPDWVLKPDVEHKDAAEREMELLSSHGRGRRKRKATMDMDMLTELEWMKVVEGVMSKEEAFERKFNRKKARRSSVGEGAAREGGSNEEVEDSDEVGVRHANGTADEVHALNGGDSGQNDLGNDDGVGNVLAMTNGFLDSDEEEAKAGPASEGGRRKRGKQNGRVDDTSGVIDGSKTVSGTQETANGDSMEESPKPFARRSKMMRRGEETRSVLLKLRIRPSANVGSEVAVGDNNVVSERRRKSSGKKRARLRDTVVSVTGGAVASGTKVKIRLPAPPEKKRKEREDESKVAKASSLKIVIPAEQVGAADDANDVNAAGGDGGDAGVRRSGRKRRKRVVGEREEIGEATSGGGNGGGLGGRRVKGKAKAATKDESVKAKVRIRRNGVCAKRESHDGEELALGNGAGDGDGRGNTRSEYGMRKGSVLLRLRLRQGDG